MPAIQPRTVAPAPLSRPVLPPMNDPAAGDIQKVAASLKQNLRIEDSAQEWSLRSDDDEGFDDDFGDDGTEDFEEDEELEDDEQEEEELDDLDEDEDSDDYDDEEDFDELDDYDEEEEGDDDY